MHAEQYYPPRVSETGQIYGSLTPSNERWPPDALFSTITHGDANAVRDAMNRTQFDMSAVDSEGRTPLHLAIASGKCDIAIMLLENSGRGMSAAINAVNRDGYTPLMLAVERLAVDSRNLPLVVSLIDRGGSISADCDREHATQKHDTNTNALLLLATNGNVAASHTLALKICASSFERLFAEQHAALRSACEGGDTVRVRTLIGEGADASFVLMRMLEQHAPLSAARGKAVRHLISMGADLSLALTHAIAANSMPAVRALLLLGAAGEQALMRAAEDHDRKAMRLLVGSGVKAESTLINQAKNGGVEAVRLLLDDALISGGLDKTRVLTALTASGSQNAVKLLMDQGVEVHDALLQQLKLGNKDEAKLLIRAGANVSGLLHTLATGAIDHPDEIDPLRTLIVLGVDPAPALYDMANGHKKTEVKMLIAAGASIDDALMYAPVSERADLERMLMQAWTEVALTREQMARAGCLDGTLASKIMTAQDYIASPKGETYKTIIQAMTRHAEDDRRHFSALLQALERVDWKLLNELVDADETAAGEALMLLTRLDCLPLARLLVDAGAQAGHAIVDGVDNHKLDRLSFLIRAGCHESVVLANLVIREKGRDFARALIQRERLDVLKTLKYLVAHGEEPRLRQFIPAITDGRRELIRAAAENDRELMQALIVAGVDVRKALVSAISEAEIDAANHLLFLEINTAGVLTEALAQKQDDVAHVLLVLGADPSIALRHATSLLDQEVVSRLVDLMRQ